MPEPAGRVEAERPRKPLFPNPLYVLLLAVSTAFVVTALAYLVSPMIAEKARRAGVNPGLDASPMAAWFDRNGPWALGVEFAAMLLFGVLAMATDHWFGSKLEPRGRR